MDEFRDKDGKFKAGNLFSVGLTNNGVPPMYDDANKMAEKIAGYLNWEDAQKRPDSFSKMGKGVYTLSGLALFLGFASLQSLYDYEKKGTDFAYILNRFRLFMTHWNEQKMYWGGTYPAAQFWLRNHGGYTEETVQNQNQKVTNVTVEVIPSEHKINNSEKDIEI
jgi:hypothetical protein